MDGMGDEAGRGWRGWSGVLMNPHAVGGGIRKAAARAFYFYSIVLGLARLKPSPWPAF